MVGPALLCDQSPLGFTSMLATTFLYGVIYALHLALGGYTLTIVLQRHKAAPHYRKHAAFIVSLAVLGTVNIAAYLAPLPACNHLFSERSLDINSVHAVMEFLHRQDLETLGIHVDDLTTTSQKLLDEPEAYYKHPIPMREIRRVQHVAALLINILVQAYLLYRCHLLFARKLVIGGLSFLLIAVIGLGIGNVLLLPGDSAFAPHMYSTDHIVPRTYWALALAFNLGANLLIITRLLWLRAKVCSAMGRDYGTVYTGLAAMLMESSLLYSVVLVAGYLFLPGSGGANSMFSPLVTQVEAIAAELIILRIALGRAMTKQVVATVTAAPPHDRDDTDPSRNSLAASSASLESKKASVVNPKRVLPVWMPRISSRARTRGLDSSGTFTQFPSSIAAVLRSHAETNPSTTVDHSHSSK